jgi:hypothetical protein
MIFTPHFLDNEERKIAIFLSSLSKKWGVIPNDASQTMRLLKWQKYIPWLLSFQQGND